MKICTEEGLTFDDVLLVPRLNTIESRRDVTLKTRLTRDLEIGSPIISANMDTVTGSLMMIAMHFESGVGILHRFLSLEETEKELKHVQSILHPDEPGACHTPVCASLGVNGEAVERLDILLQYCDAICIDVAHGHSQQVISMIKRIKDRSNCPQVIAGNVATKEATQDLITAGADAIKVGIGPGSMCTTRLVTGNGIPQLTAIMECHKIAKLYEVPIIADGGFKTSGDVVKALAAGAESIMSGSFFAGTEESPGELIEQGNKRFKSYRGMASEDAMIGWKGKGYHAAPEGEATVVPFKGSVHSVMQSVLGGIRSGMTYQGACTLEELRQFATFRRVSPNCITENKPHGKF